MNTRILHVTIPISINNHNFAAEVADFCNATPENRPVITDGVSCAKLLLSELRLSNPSQHESLLNPDYNY